MGITRGLAVLILAMALTSCTTPTGQPQSFGCPHSIPGGGSLIDWVNFVHLNGIEYLAPPSIRTSLQPNQVGAVVATVRCRMEGTVLDSAYRPHDGDAAFLDPGTPLYAVNGYKTSFRLAAREDGKLTLFEADSNPAAKVGADLLDISGKVQYIGINSEQDGVTELAAIHDRTVLDGLVRMVLQAPVNQQLADHSTARYFIAFHLNDGTSVVRAYWPSTGELSRGIILPKQFRQAIEQSVVP